MSKDKEEPAFPGLREPRMEESYPSWMSFFQGGLTKREWFAGMALMGMHAINRYDKGLATPEQRANICFIDADAMIEASKK